MNTLFSRAALTLVALGLNQPTQAQSQVESQVLPSALCADGQCRPAISAVEYGGRRAYELTDGRTEAIIVPAIGRVMRFGKVGGPNLLWNVTVPPAKDSAWKNYGGDKTWLAPQTSWTKFHGFGWPPDPALDGQAHRAEVLTGGKLRLTSPLSASGIRLTRTLYFNDKGEFIIEQMARKEKGAQLQASLWDVCQIVPGEAIFLPRSEGSTYPNGFAPIDQQKESQKIEGVNPRLLRVTASNRGGGSKIGVDGPISSLASVRDGVAFLQKSAKPLGTYPDAQGGAGLSIEVYTQGDPKNFYCELEVLGPLKNFALGGKSTQTLRWSLHDLPSKDVNSPAVVSAVEKLIYAQ